MTEQEYIDVGNLTKLRAASSILLDCLFPENDEHRKMCKSLYARILTLEDKITTTKSPK